MTEEYLHFYRFHFDLCTTVICIQWLLNRPVPGSIGYCPWYGAWQYYIMYGAWQYYILPGNIQYCPGFGSALALGLDRI